MDEQEQITRMLQRLLQKRAQSSGGASSASGGGGFSFKAGADVRPTESMKALIASGYSEPKLLELANTFNSFHGSPEGNAEGQSSANLITELIRASAITKNAAARQAMAEAKASEQALRPGGTPRVQGSSFNPNKGSGSRQPLKVYDQSYRAMRGGNNFNSARNENKFRRDERAKDFSQTQELLKALIGSIPKDTLTRTRETLVNIAGNPEKRTLKETVPYDVTQFLSLLS